MPMKLSPQDAATALAEVDLARTAMRHVIREHRGHYYLWIWGATWIAMPLTAYFAGDGAVRYFALICLPGILASVAVSLVQRRQISSPDSFRPFGVMAGILLFAVIFPFVLHGRPDPRAYYAYACLACMQAYVVMGLWVDRYLLWLGLFVAAMILVGFFLLPGIFWLWMALFAGGPLVLTGFYIRHCWR
jgi:hypothetical protein